MFTKSFVNALSFDGLKLKLEMSEGSLRSHSLLWNDHSGQAADVFGAQPGGFGESGAPTSPLEKRLFTDYTET